MYIYYFKKGLIYRIEIITEIVKWPFGFVSCTPSMFASLRTLKCGVYLEKLNVIGFIPIYTICRDPSRCPRGTLYPQKLALIWSTSGGRSVGIVRSRTQATEVFC
jgi:hypothetical protein